MPSVTSFPTSVTGSPATLRFVQSVATAQVTVTPATGDANHALVVFVKNLRTGNLLANADVTVRRTSDYGLVASGQTAANLPKIFHVPYGNYIVTASKVVGPVSGSVKASKSINFVTDSGGGNVVEIGLNTDSGVIGGGDEALNVTVTSGGSALGGAIVMVRPLVDFGGLSDTYAPTVNQSFPVLHYFGAGVGVYTWGRTGPSGTVQLFPAKTITLGGIAKSVTRFGLYVAKAGHYPSSQEIAALGSVSVSLSQQPASSGGARVRALITRPDSSTTSSVIAFVRDQFGVIAAGPCLVAEGASATQDFSVGGNGPYTLAVTSGFLDSGTATFTMSSLPSLSFALATKTVTAPAGSSTLSLSIRNAAGSLVTDQVVVWLSTDANGQTVVKRGSTSNGSLTFVSLDASTTYYIWCADGYATGTGSATTTGGTVSATITMASSPFVATEVAGVISPSSLKNAFPVFDSECIFFVTDEQGDRYLPAAGQGFSPDEFGNLFIPIPSSFVASGCALQAHIVSAPMTAGNRTISSLPT